MFRRHDRYRLIVQRKQALRSKQLRSGSDVAPSRWLKHAIRWSGKWWSGTTAPAPQAPQLTRLVAPVTGKSMNVEMRVAVCRDCGGHFRFGEEKADQKKKDTSWRASRMKRVGAMVRACTRTSAPSSSPPSPTAGSLSILHGTGLGVSPVHYSVVGKLRRVSLRIGTRRDTGRRTLGEFQPE
jgi:hypothetical protein